MSGGNGSIRTDSIGKWLRQGLELFNRGRLVSGVYAGVFLLIGLVMALPLLLSGFSLVFFILASGFLIVAPVLAGIYYRFAEKLVAGATLSWRDILQGVKSSPMAAWVIGLVSFAIYLIWVTDALILYSVYFTLDPITLGDIDTNPGFRDDVLAFIFFVDIMGLVLAFIAYCITVLSIPHAYRQGSGLVDSVVFGIKAIGRNPKVMLTWALLVGAVMMLTLIFLMPFILLVFPVLAYANHAAYQDLLAQVDDTEE